MRQKVLKIVKSIYQYINISVMFGTSTTTKTYTEMWTW